MIFPSNNLNLFPKYLEESDNKFLKLSTCKFWNGSDNYETYEKNLQTKPENWRYREKAISYACNSSGYRTREWCDIDWKESIVLLGDSCTFGVGLAEDETISYQLEKMLNRPVINLGIPGGSDSTLLQNSSIIINKFEIPWCVVAMWPPNDRLRYFDHSKFVEVGAWNVQDEYSKLWCETFKNQSHEVMQMYYNSEILSSIWKTRTRYITRTFFPRSSMYTKNAVLLPYLPAARDDIHPCYNSAKAAALSILRELRKHE